jgi:hypothetical protein
VYAPVPPLAETDAAPLLPPLQATLVWEAAVALNAEGWVTTTVTVVVLLALSVMVRV